MAKKKKTRSKPRISINSLVAYMAARPYQRQAILRDHKYPTGGIPNYYIFARRAIEDFVVTGLADEESLASEITRLNGLPAKDNLEAQKFASNADAISCFMRLSDDFDISDVRATRTSTKTKKLALEGVDVSVWPELTLNGKRSAVGGINLCISKKTTGLIEPSVAEYGAVMISQYSEKYLTNGTKKVRGKLCLFVDVFGKEIYEAPSSQKLRMRDVRAACTEIAAMWPKI